MQIRISHLFFPPCENYMNILHVAPISLKAISGITETVANSLPAQQRVPGVRVGLLMSGNDATRPSWDGIPILSKRELVERNDRGTWLSTIRKAIFHPDLVVFHSTFIPLHAQLATQLSQLGIPYIICPRGGMTRQALAHKPWKKWLGRRLFFDQFVAGASAIHFLRQGEYEHSGDWGRPVIFAGNGVWPPAERNCAHPGTGSQRVFMFLGRLHIRHKGLDALLQACHRCHNLLRQKNVQIRLVGPDVNGSRQILENFIKEHQLGDIATLVGPVRGEARTREYATADVFLHPSRWEGHPNAVLQALAHGLPVLITNETNMLADVVTAGAGWGVSTDPTDLARELVRLASLPTRILAEAGQAARRLILSDYTWDRVAEETTAKYRQLLACRAYAA